VVVNRVLFLFLFVSGVFNAVPSEAALRPALAHDSFNEDDIDGIRNYLDVPVSVRGHRFTSDRARAGFLKGVLRLLDLHGRYLPGLGRDRELAAVMHPIFIAHLEGARIDVKSVRLLSGLSPATAHRKIQRLVDLGYVRKVREQEDRRRIFLVPSEEATARYRRGSDDVAAMVEDALRPFSADALADDDDIGRPYDADPDAAKRPRSSTV
jgi:DNA-binding MarR family transcriptional regulator